LIAGTNTIIISAFDTAMAVIARDTVSLTYTTGTTVDNEPPYINSISVNGVEGRAHFINGDAAYLTLEVFDEHMDSVVINGRVKQPSAKYLWKDTLALTGAAQYFFVYCSDSSGNATLDTVRVQRNYVPRIDPPVSWPKTLILGKTWSAQFTVVDEDRDSIAIVQKGAQSTDIGAIGAITFKQIGAWRWTVTWNGGSTLTGQAVNQKIRTQVVVSDQKQQNNYTWDFTVKDSTQADGYIFAMFLPEGVDTTASGELNLSYVDAPVSVPCLVTSDAMSLISSDSIAVIQPDRTIKFAATSDTCVFTLTFNPLGKSGIDTIIVMIVDSAGSETPVDTVRIFYSFDYPSALDSLGWQLRADTGIVAEGKNVLQWRSVSQPIAALTTMVFNKNNFTNTEYGIKTMPAVSQPLDSDYPSVLFTPENHSNLLADMSGSWITKPFTFFIIAKQSAGTRNTGDNILVGTGTAGCIGLGVFRGRMGLVASIDSASAGIPDTAFVSANKVSRGKWHIFCFSAKQGMSNDQNAFILDTWLDTYSDGGSAVSVPSMKFTSDKAYLVLGGGSKHYAQKNWDGDVTEVMNFPRYLSAEERMKVMQYLGSKHNIRVR
jgi:hypothetical protein